MCTGAEIMAVGSVVKGVGGMASKFSLANDYEDRATDILESSKDTMQRSSKVRERRRGVMRAAYAKGGVEMTGTARTLTDEQIRADEKELLRQKYNAQLEVSQAYEQAQEARKQGIFSLVGGAIQGYGEWKNG